MCRSTIHDSAHNSGSSSFLMVVLIHYLYQSLSGDRLRMEWCAAHTQNLYTHTHRDQSTLDDDDDVFLISLTIGLESSSSSDETVDVIDIRQSFAFPVSVEYVTNRERKKPIEYII